VGSSVATVAEAFLGVYFCDWVCVGLPWTDLSLDTISNRTFYDHTEL
jgi:hypothetical protein